MVYSPFASQLLERAELEAKRRGDRALDVLHVLLAVVHDPTSAGDASDVFVRIARDQRDAWANRIVRELVDHLPPALPYERQTARLRDFEAFWSNWARTNIPGGRINCSLVLYTIVRSTGGMQMMEHCFIQSAELIQTLHDRRYFEEGTARHPNGFADGGDVWRDGLREDWPDASTRRTSLRDEIRHDVDWPWHSQSAWPTPSPADRGGGQPPVSAQSLFAQYAHPVQPSPTGVYADAHTRLVVQMRQYLDVSWGAREILIFAGRCGSPVEVVSEILADHLATSQVESPVRRIYLREILPLLKRDEHDTELIVALAREAFRTNVTLVIEGLELLNQKGMDVDVQQQVRDELGKVTGMALIGVYRLADGENFSQMQAIVGLTNAFAAPVEEWDDGGTRRVLRDHFIDALEQERFTFHDGADAFESVLKLADYLGTDERQRYHQTAEPSYLPYSVISVGRELIETLSSTTGKHMAVNGYTRVNGREFEAQHLRSAMSELAAGAEKELLRVQFYPWAKTSEMQALLRKVGEDLRQLRKDVEKKEEPRYVRARSESRMRLRGGQADRVELRAVHLMAQLLYPGKTQLLPEMPLSRVAIGARLTTERHDDPGTTPS